MKVKDFVIALLLTLSTLLVLSAVDQVNKTVDFMKKQIGQNAIDVFSLKERYNSLDEEYVSKKEIGELKKQIEVYLEEVQYLKNDFSGWQGMWDSLFGRSQKAYTDRYGEGSN